MKNQTSDLQIPRSDALPLSHSDSTTSKVYREVHLTCVLHTARISNVDGVVFVMLMTRRKTSFSISLPSSKLTISTYSIYKHDAIDIVDPNSMQDACHMNFVIDPTHQTVSMVQW